MQHGAGQGAQILDHGAPGKGVDVDRGKFDAGLLQDGGDIRQV